MEMSPKYYSQKMKGESRKRMCGKSLESRFVILAELTIGGNFEVIANDERKMKGRIKFVQLMLHPLCLVFVVLDQIFIHGFFQTERVIQ